MRRMTPIKIGVCAVSLCAAISLVAWKFGDDGIPTVELDVIVNSEPVTGTVVDIEGRPLADARIVNHSRPSKAIATTDPSGRYWLQNLSSTDLLTVHKDGYFNSTPEASFHKRIQLRRLPESDYDGYQWVH